MSSLMVAAGFTLIMTARAMARQAEGEACPPQVIAASDAGASDSFGYSVAIDGDVAVAGAIWDDQVAFDAGAAYIFRRKGGVWVQEQKLVASDGQQGHTFGRFVAVDGDVAVVGANNGNGAAEGTGCAYVYRFVGDRWIEESKLFGLDGQFGDGFGRTCAVSGDHIAVGASGNDESGLNAGAAYVFRHDGETWVQEQKLLASDGAENDSFGGGVAIEGDWILVGASDADGLTLNAGAVYSFQWTGATWVEEQKLVADDPGGPIDGVFGRALSLSFDSSTTIIGDHVDDDVGWGNGSAYIFKYDGEKWVQAQEFYLPDPQGTGNDFGRSVSIDGDRAIVGAYHVSDSDGAAYVYRYDEATDLWELQEELLPSAIPSTSFFGWSVGISEGTAIVSAHGEFGQSGRAYMFDVAPATGDLDCDGEVGPGDLAELLAHWGQCESKRACPADIAPPFGEGDGIVGPADLAVLLSTWG